MINKDIDECSTRNHSCENSSLCLNTLGSFKCQQKIKCPNGFTTGECKGNFFIVIFYKVNIDFYYYNDYWK